VPLGDLLADGWTVDIAALDYEAIRFQLPREGTPGYTDLDPLALSQHVARQIEHEPPIGSDLGDGVHLSIHHWAEKTGLYQSDG
jgi:hypothetical protein